MKKEIGKFFILSTLFCILMLLGSAFECLMSLPAVFAGLALCCIALHLICRFLMVEPPVRRTITASMHRSAQPQLRVVRGSRRRAA